MSALAATDLLGEPHRKGSLSQFFTPMWLARRAAQWVPLAATVIEPSAGRGNLVQALLERGLRVDQISAVEVDPEWCAWLAARWPRLALANGDFLRGVALRGDRFSHAFMNPPYESGADGAHLARALEVADRVVAIVKADVEFGSHNDKTLWRRARVVRRARIVARPDFGKVIDREHHSPMRNYVALELVSDDAVGGAYTVEEERWWRA